MGNQGEDEKKKNRAEANAKIYYAPRQCVTGMNANQTPPYLLDSRLKLIADRVLTLVYWMDRVEKGWHR